MRFILIIALVVSLFLDVYSQYNPGAKQIAISNSGVALSNDVFAIFNNPAGLAQMNWREIGLYYSPSPFGFEELANGYIAYNEPFSFGSAAVGAMTYGFDLYRENKFTFAFSYNYENKFFAGTSANLQMISIKNYGNTSVFYFSLGGLAYLTESFRWGFSVQNVNRASIKNEADQIPFIMSSGFSYDIENSLSINFAVEKDIKYNASFMLGIDYLIIKYLSLRAGFANEPSKYSAGIGINYSFFSLDYAIFTHPDLGLTHQFGLIISFGDEKSRNEKIKEYLKR